jgi:hypothetical protein
MSKLAWTLIAAAAFVTLAACGGGSKNNATLTATKQPSGTAAATAKSTPQANTTGTPKPSPTPFVGGRDPVEGSLGTASATPSPGELADVRAAGQNGYDRITFEFRGAPPNYRVEYVTAPAQCASGAPVPLTGQQAALQVKFTPAAAHNAQSTPTVSQTSINPGMPSIVAAQQTCDFEADVTWVVILNQKVDFRVLALTDPYRLAVDVAQP